MDSNATDVIRVGLKHVYTFQGIIVEHTDLHVILPKRKKRKNLNTAGDTCHSLYYKNKNYHTPSLDYMHISLRSLYEYSLKN